MNAHAASLKSAGVARILLWLLRITLVLEGFSLISKGVAIALPTTALTLVTLQHLMTVPALLFSLTILLLSLIWIYRLHDDLRQFYKSYPIDAWDALCRFILPGYNIWGIWNTLRTIARYFKAEIGRLHRYGLRLDRLVVVMYGNIMTLYLLDRLLYKYDSLGRVESMRNIPGFLIPVAIAAKELLGLVGTLVLLAIAQTIINAIHIKANQISKSEKSVHP